MSFNDIQRNLLFCNKPYPIYILTKSERKNINKISRKVKHATQALRHPFLITYFLLSTSKITSWDSRYNFLCHFVKTNLKLVNKIFFFCCCRYWIKLKILIIQKQDWLQIVHYNRRIKRFWTTTYLVSLVQALSVGQMTPHFKFADATRTRRETHTEDCERVANSVGLCRLTNTKARMHQQETIEKNRGVRLNFERNEMKHEFQIDLWLINLLFDDYRVIVLKLCSLNCLETFHRFENEIMWTKSIKIHFNEIVQNRTACKVMWNIF